ncbi:hypothetical protein VOLCADRAFT_86623 [Volvox carteri f. nagariensis]|uniref:Secreted protein n=1 Tax=Volvox carteri f. nagariensis TaxID=3068 RepID=D8TJ60_VOLCA|nr:uncharacterized protein VOLCADRAFT_86623 [Volvox carteri f. nagariensis]EFJ52482.1 hypothetical protein VOLCADRAFT_86623 [Volvox carteri f. nagariensis]|eukprot:XP_002946555.1 hypothetical protein VOLCADRAFT_86623 [Volvox carteri f. nagariensis]
MKTTSSLLLVSLPVGASLRGVARGWSGINSSFDEGTFEYLINLRSLYVLPCQGIGVPLPPLGSMARSHEPELSSAASSWQLAALTTNTIHGTEAGAFENAMTLTALRNLLPAF